MVSVIQGVRLKSDPGGRLSAVRDYPRLRMTFTVLTALVSDT